MATRKEGSFIEIPLPDGKFGYGRILAKADYAFYDIHADEPITNIERIRQSEILFIVAIYKHAITKGRWKKIGYLDLDQQSKVLPLKFMEDALNPGFFELYNPNTGEITTATKDKCYGLERSAVWDPEHVESRLVDHFAGKPNRWVEQLRLK